jgi:hypothetical protein
METSDRVISPTPVISPRFTLSGEEFKFRAIFSNLLLLLHSNGKIFLVSTSL